MTRARNLSRLGNLNAITATEGNLIGIGSTTPGNKLTVVGDANITGVITAVSFSGSGSGLTGVASTDNIVTSTLAQFNAGVGIADSIFHQDDTNTAIRFPSADTFTIETGGDEALRVDSDGRVRLNGAAGVSTFSARLQTDGNIHLRPITDVVGAGFTGVVLDVLNNASSAVRDIAFRGDTTIFRNSSAETIRIDRDGRLLVGTTSLIDSSTASNFQIASSSGPRLCVARNNTNVTGGNLMGAFDFYGNDSDGNFEICGRMLCEADGTHATNDKPTRLAFYTTPSGTDTATERLRIENDGSIVPGADATQDLGATDRRFANIFSADVQLSNEGSANDVDGTWGKYTIQEGEDDLFLINRRNGKKYKFVLQEVN